MATIMSLPQEVFNIILGYNDISVEDIINFRCVCKQFQWVGKYDKYMEKKFFQRWSSAKKLYDKHCQEKVQKTSKENEQENKKGLNFMETGINCARKLRNYMSLILRNLTEQKSKIDNLMIYDDLIYFDLCLNNKIFDIVYEPENIIKHLFFIDEFKNLLTQPPLTDYDLTEKYYHINIFRFMRQCLVKKKFFRFMDQSYKNQVLERMFTMIAQYIQPEKDIFYSNIEASLDDITSEVLKCLREKHPDHSILSIPSEICSYWKNNNIHDNHWNETEGTQIMDTLEEYIFSKFQLNEWRLFLSDPIVFRQEYMCIDYVLKNKFGTELIFLIIYHSVARRLGLRCDVIGGNSHFFILWNSKYPANSLRNARCFDICSNKFLAEYFCIKEHLSNMYSEAGDFQQLMIGQMWQKQIMHKFEFMLDKFDTQCYNSNILSFYKEETELRTRPEDIKFAVGMIVTHHSTECAGVIVGWHQYFYDGYIIRFSADNRTCISCHMHMYELPLTHCSNFDFLTNQTNYIILTENNKMCYVEEDAITLTTPRWINNSEIGRYFCKFEGTHYVPNKMLARLYPQDAAITATLQHH